MTQFLLFLVSFVSGAALRPVYFLERLLAKKTALKPVTIILDVLFCACCLVVFLLLSHLLAFGKFHFFMLCGVLAGFFLVSIWL